MTQITHENFTAIYKKLTPNQREVFEQAAVNNDAGHSRQTLESLVRKGLVKLEWVKSGPYNVRRYFVPLPVHYAWCMWCAENVGDEE